MIMTARERYVLVRGLCRLAVFGLIGWGVLWVAQVFIVTAWALMGR
jgi:hypothetical protein